MNDPTLNYFALPPMEDLELKGAQAERLGTLRISLGEFHGNLNKPAPVILRYTPAEIMEIQAMFFTKLARIIHVEVHDTDNHDPDQVALVAARIATLFLLRSRMSPAAAWTRYHEIKRVVARTPKWTLCQLLYRGAHLADNQLHCSIFDLEDGTWIN